MCHANSVLQLLVFCTPFQRLFAELGKVLSGSAVIGFSGSDSLVNGSGPLPSSTSTPINGLNGKGKEKDKDAIGMTPLVDATVEFLREFMDDKKSKTKKQVHSKKGSIGSGPAVTSKGKEKETLDGVVNDSSGEVDWEGCDSFLPTYVYDAMKLKKRFMRVCSLFSFLTPLHLSIFQHLLTTICLFLYRMVIKKMLKSSSGFTLRLLKKSFFHYYTLLTHPSRRKWMLLWKRKRKRLLLKVVVGWRLENGIGLLLHEQ